MTAEAVSDRAAFPAGSVDAGVVTGITITPLAVPLERPMLWAGGRDEHAVQLLVQISTDMGLTGLGECPAALDAEAVRSAARHFASILVGRRVAELVLLPPAAYVQGRWRYFRRLANYAICGLEMALWDLSAKAAGVPVHALLGGARRNSISHFCWLHRGGTLDDLLAQASQGLAAGHDVFYVKVGIGESATEVVALVEALRDTLGPTSRLRLDANEAWTLDEALRVLDAVAGCNLDWVEEPVAGTSAADLRRIRDGLGVRVAVDQGAWLPEDILALAGERAVDVVCTDPSRVGGLSELVRLAASLDELDVEVCRHCGNEFGIFLAASLHACATIPNLTSGNQYCDQLGWDIVEGLEIASAEFPVPTRPGLGIVLNEDRVAAARAHYEQVFHT